MTKRVLFVVTALPRVGLLANEALDLLLVAAAFDLRPTVLFAGDGVYQLLPGAASAATGIRDVGRAYEALPAYDVERIFVERAALDRAGLPREALTLPVTPLDESEIRSLISDHDVVFTS